jgi:hypothetical protein
MEKWVRKNASAFVDRFSSRQAGMAFQVMT